ncbi:hypothetical protein ACQEWB_21205 [Streptomyces sp. CA-249302]|uniref:hypothetical protein n=1 Tax=Streptomyces sp. CA-249302 TaxID=3240058 RepID=UPI003D8E1225
MELGTLAVAVVGAVFGVATTLVTDLVRSRREQDRYWNETKRVVYARFLTSLAQTHSRMIRAAFGGQPDDARRDGVHDAFHNDPQDSNAKALLRELGIVSPDHVYQAALPVYGQLQVMRDLLAAHSLRPESTEYDEVRGPFFRDLETLQKVMRDDLQPKTSRRSRLVRSLD